MPQIIMPYFPWLENGKIIKYMNNPTPEFHSEFLFPESKSNDNFYVNQSFRKKSILPKERN